MTIYCPVAPFSLEDAEVAMDAWGFNCGPAAISAACDIPPDALRGELGDFEQKGYLSPSMMESTLRGLSRAYNVDKMRASDVDPDRSRTFRMPRETGLVRVQFGGPWCRPGVPIAARYCYTHWAAIRCDGGVPIFAFDINAMGVGGWIGYREWADDMIPWLIADGMRSNQAYRRADGTWWLTHVYSLL